MDDVYPNNRFCNMFFKAFRIITAIQRSLPDFIIIGAQRCGTTSLYNYLANNPNVASSYVKEIHFFDHNYNKGLLWYRSFFPLKIIKGKRITGEATPYYIFHPYVAMRIAKTLPSVKLIVMLRNPVDRAYSHYWHEVRMGVETLSFEEAIKKEKNRLNNELEKLLINENYKSFNHQHFSYISRGIYVEQLKRWFSLFPRKNFLIIRSEDFYENPKKILYEVEYFFNIPKWAPRVYKIFQKGTYPPMKKSTRRKLIEFFKPYNNELYKLINRNMKWNE